MQNFAIIFFQILNLVSLQVLGQHSPCPSVFSYRTSVSSDHISTRFALIEIPKSQAAETRKVLNVKLTVAEPSTVI